MNYTSPLAAPAEAAENEAQPEAMQMDISGGYLGGDALMGALLAAPGGQAETAPADTSDEAADAVAEIAGEGEMDALIDTYAEATVPAEVPTVDIAVILDAQVGSGSQFAGTGPDLTDTADALEAAAVTHIA